MDESVELKDILSLFNDECFLFSGWSLMDKCFDVLISIMEKKGAEGYIQLIEGLDNIPKQGYKCGLCKIISYCLRKNVTVQNQCHLVKLIGSLRGKPLTKIYNLYMFDGNGYLHPRHMGIATHASFFLNRPTIGVAKNYYKIKDVEYSMPPNEKFAYTDIMVDGEIYGRVLFQVKRGHALMYQKRYMIKLLHME